MPLFRYSKLTMHSKIVCKIAEHALAKYKELGIEPYHHMIINDDKVYVYIWDTRLIEHIISAKQIDANDVDYQVIDNRMDIVCDKSKVSAELWNIAMNDKEVMPIIFVDGELTDHEKELLTIEHI